MSRIRRSRHGRPFVRVVASVLTLMAGMAVAFAASGAASVTATTGTTATTTTTAAGKPPQNVDPPQISGTPQEAQVLKGDKGSWKNSPTDYNYFWTRCDKNGGSCSNIAGAHGATYTLTSADVGNTVRFKVQATNASGSDFASSVPTAVIVAATKPPPPPPPPPTPAANGCPAGTGAALVTGITPPARLIIDQQQASPDVVHAGTQQIIVRYHVTACGRPVQGALVYATAVPFNQLSIPPEQPTGADGYAELDFRTLAGFPVSPRQSLIAIFVRARKQGESVLGGISGRRLFSIKVNLHA